MSLASPSTQSVQAFLFGQEDASTSHSCSDEEVHPEVEKKRQSMYIELLDGA
jgi:hypothetical protein